MPGQDTEKTSDDERAISKEVDGVDQNTVNEEYDFLDSKLDELNSALDFIEQKNDDIVQKLKELLQSNIEIRQELKNGTNQQMQQ